MGGACGAPRLLGIYLISKMHTKTIQKIQKAYIKTYEEDVEIYKYIENSQWQGAFFLKTPVYHRDPGVRVLGATGPGHQEVSGPKKHWRTLGGREEGLEKTKPKSNK